MAVKDFITISDAKQTVEKAVAEKPTLQELTTVESPGRPTPSSMLESGERERKKVRRSGKRKFEKSEETRITEPEKNSILIITEKPQAAQKIAFALGKAMKYSEHGVSYYEISSDGEKIVIASAVGHLFNLTYKEGQKGWPIFELEWTPSYKRSQSAFTKRYFDLLKKLARKAKEVVVASVDYEEITPIIEKDEFKLIKIGEMVDSILEGKRKENEILVSSFDEEGNLRWNKLKKAIKHEINENLYELSLEYGRKIKLTSSHSVFVLENKKIKTIKTSDLKEGDKILCPSILPAIEESPGEINILKILKNDTKRDIYVVGKDIAQIIKKRTINSQRRDSYLNKPRIILTVEAQQKLRNERLQKKISTVKMAESLGVSQSIVSFWERGIKNPTEQNLLAYLKMLDMPNDFINNEQYCKKTKPSFMNVLLNNYITQYKEYSNLARATLSLDELLKEEIEKIKEGKIYGSKNRRNALPIKINISKDLMRLLGYYLAEGDINNDYRTRFSLGLVGYGHESKIIEEIKSFCGKYNLSNHYYLHNRIKHQIITVDNTVLAHLIKSLFYLENDRYEKRIPRIIFNLSSELKKEFLRAYFLGDGSLSKRSICFNTSSEKIATDLSYLLLQLGILAGISRSVHKTSKGGEIMWHVTISNTKDLKRTEEIWEDHYKSKILKLSSRNRKDRENFGNLTTLKIKKIKKINSSTEYVYDLSVQGENFIAGLGGVCCHNTDYDIEGEVIGWNVLRFICQRESAKRMKFSTLTADELKKAFDSPLPELDWGNAYAGETRHYIDWLYGINLSRALMSSLKKNGSFKIMSIGRVQGPALKIIIEREREIQNFKSVPYWQVFAVCKDLELKHPKDIFDKSVLEIFKEIKEGIAETKKSEESIAPPHPFDLTTLQREAYRLYKINPSETLSIAQKLYLDGLISYPRTSSQKIPFSIEPKKILKALEKRFPEAKLATRDKPVEGKKSDPAHPSIYPSGEFADLSGREEKLYSLIVKRFIAAFSPDAKTANKKIILNAINKEGKMITYYETDKKLGEENNLQKQLDEDEEETLEKGSDSGKKNNVEKSNRERTQKEIPITFAASGLTVLEKGWTSFYPIKLEEQTLPDLNGKVKIDKIKVEEKETMPPPRYTPASLVSLLEKRGLGTKSTRSMIVDTLFDRGYLDGRSIQATPLGLKLIESLEKYSPIIIDESLTRQLEEEMEKIREAKTDFQKRESEILEKAKRLISDIAKEFKSKELEIGKELMRGIEHQRNEQIKNNTLMLCPLCKQGDLRILYSKKTRRYFVACSKYPDCRQTYSLPPNALIKKAETQCPADLFPKLLAIRKGKRPWEFCFNPQCPIETQKRTEWEK